MIVGIQIIGILFGLLMLYLVFIRIKRRDFTVKESIFWAFCWSFFIFISIWPTSLDIISWKILKLSRTMDLIIILGFIFLSGITFYMYTLFRQSQKQIDAIIRNIALDKAENKSKENKEEKK